MGENPKKAMSHLAITLDEDREGNITCYFIKTSSGVLFSFAHREKKEASQSFRA